MQNEPNLVVDALPGLVWTALPDGDVDFLNRRWFEYTGLGVDEARGRGWQSAIHPGDRSDLLERWRLMLASGEPREMQARLRRFDGEYRWFLIRTLPLADASGKVVKWCGLGIDIDERKRADAVLAGTEAELKRSEAFLAEAQRLSSTGSFSWRVGTNEFTWSEQLYRIYEFDQGVPVTHELIGTRDPRWASERMDWALNDGKDFEGDYQIQMPDGSVKHLHFVAHAARDQDGQPQYIGAVQDVTQRRRNEEALAKVRSELAHVARITSLGALTASIAHEVNQPLSGIMTNASTCLRMLTGDRPNLDGARETARRTLRDADRASEVIKRLRALFSKKPAALELVDLNQATREVMALSRSELQRSRVALRAKLADNLPPVMGDRVQLQQVILNLLLNASEAMSGVDDRPRTLVVKTESDEGDRVRLSVQDSGTGFAPEDAERLFEAFYTTKSGGMGIGLSVSRSIIENHHGRLWAEPNDGSGATFSFSIPRAHSSGDRPSSTVGRSSLTVGWMRTCR